MQKIRCPSCRMRLWLYQGMGRDVPPPEHCPACHVSRPIDHTGSAAAHEGDQDPASVVAPDAGDKRTR